MIKGDFIMKEFVMNCWKTVTEKIDNLSMESANEKPLRDFGEYLGFLVGGILEIGRAHV